MRKLVTAFLMSMLIMVCGICSAQITEEDLNIGGIYIGQSMDEILEKYGDSIRTEPLAPKGYAFVFKVDDSEISIVPDKERKVFSFGIENSSGLKTGAGIGLGMSFADLKSVYGTPDSVKDVNTGTTVMYFTPKVYSDGSSYWEYYYNVLTFFIQNDVIKRIYTNREFKYLAEMP